MSLKYCVIYDDYPQYRKKDKCRQIILRFALIILCLVLLLYFCYLENGVDCKVYRPELMSVKSKVFNLLCDFIRWKEKFAASLLAFNKMLFDGR